MFRCRSKICIDGGFDIYVQCTLFKGHCGRHQGKYTEDRLDANIDWNESDLWIQHERLGLLSQHIYSRLSGHIEKKKLLKPLSNERLDELTDLQTKIDNLHTESLNALIKEFEKIS